jgi:hypothetical protein
MQNDSEGALQNFLLELDPEKEGIENQEELILYLYEQSGEQDYSEEDVDLILAETASGGDATLLRAKLIENSEGSLNAYLVALDLDPRGISDSGELIKHLQEVADAEGFTMNEVRNAMRMGLDQGDGTGALLSKLQLKSQGALRDQLVSLESDDQGLATQEELFEYLYEQTGPGGYTRSEVDVLLADVLSDGDAKLLLQQMLENSDGALNAYLGQLDLEAEGIRSSEDLLKHLESAAETEEFSMEDLREAMLDSLEEALEVHQLYEELLEHSDGPFREILESVDLQGSKIHTVDQLISLVDSELENRGLSKNERRQLLGELFGEVYDESSSGKGKISWPLLAILGLAAAGLFILIIAWWRRREKGDEQGD